MIVVLCVSVVVLERDASIEVSPGNCRCVTNRCVAVFSSVVADAVEGQGRTIMSLRSPLSPSSSNAADGTETARNDFTVSNAHKIKI